MYSDGVLHDTFDDVADVKWLPMWLGMIYDDLGILMYSSF